LAVSWLVFPLVPVILEDLYFQTFTLEILRSARPGQDPHDWDWLLWVIMLGPLVGYGFLAGATLHTPDEGGRWRRGLGRLLGRRAVWVAFGPWCGFLFWAGVYFGLVFLDKLIPVDWRPDVPFPEWWAQTWVYWVASWVIIVVFWATLAYGWLWPSW